MLSVLHFECPDSPATCFAHVPQSAPTSCRRDRKRSLLQLLDYDRGYNNGPAVTPSCRAGQNEETKCHTPRKMRRSSVVPCELDSQETELDELDEGVAASELPSVASLMTTCSQPVVFDPPTATETAKSPRVHANSQQHSESPCSVMRLPEMVEEDEDAAGFAPLPCYAPMAPFVMSPQSLMLMNALPAHDLVRMRSHGQLPATLLPPKTSTKRLTLVLDLDETLVHCGFEPIANPDIQLDIEYGGKPYTVYGRKRPHLAAFLREASKHFELVCFTASQRLYAERIIRVIDPDGLISHSLYRDSCVNMRGTFLKDLSILGRDLRHTILLDNSPHAFGFQVDNGMPILSWFECKTDTELLATVDWLRNHVLGSDDVRPTLRSKFRVRERLSLGRRR